MHRTLHKILKSRFQDEMKNSPPFPSRKLFWCQNLDAIARERREGLDRFVRFVIENLRVGVNYGNNETAFTRGANLGSGTVLM